MKWDIPKRLTFNHLRQTSERRMWSEINYRADYKNVNGPDTYINAVSDMKNRMKLLTEKKIRNSLQKKWIVRK